MGGDVVCEFGSCSCERRQQLKGRRPAGTLAFSTAQQHRTDKRWTLFWLAQYISKNLAAQRVTVLPTMAFCTIPVQPVSPNDLTLSSLASTILNFCCIFKPKSSKLKRASLCISFFLTCCCLRPSCFVTGSNCV